MDRSNDDIIAELSDSDREKVVRHLSRLERLFEEQDKFDAAVAAAMDRILTNAPRESVRELSKQIRKRLKEIANENR
jgi:hypothetical protein